MLQKEKLLPHKQGLKWDLTVGGTLKSCGALGKNDSHQNNSETVCAVSSSVYVFFVDMLFDQIICAAAVAAVAADVT